MKSTIAKKFERIDQPDGTTVLSYVGKRLNAHQVGASAVLALPLLFVFGCLGFAGFAASTFLFGEKNAGMPALIFAVVGIVFIFNKILGSRKYALVLTNQGIIFPKSSYFNGTRQLPYGDIDKLGITQQSSSHKGGFSQTYHIHAYAGGNELQLTRNITQSLAESLLEEINRKMHGAQRAA